MHRPIAIIMLAWLPLLAGAQQYPLFSNFLNHAYGYNPATIAENDGLYANALYRLQWQGFEGAPRTQLLNVHGTLGKAPLALGGYYFNDQAGALMRLGGSAMFSFVKDLGEATRLAVGFSGGYFLLRIRPDARIQDPNDALLLNGTDEQMFADFNAGIYLRTHGFYLGFSIPQVIEREIRFTETKPAGILRRHYYGLAGYRWQLGHHIYIEPTAILKYVSGAPIQYEGSLRLDFGFLWLGGSYRSDQTLIGLVGFDAGALTFSYAYDMATSSIRHASSGSHELGVGMRFGKKRDRDGDGIPDERDRCPDQPGSKARKGCPEPEEEPEPDMPQPGDKDNDGTPDDKDKCPDLPGPRENKGCPWGDRDKDGIRDAIDECPDLPGVASNRGCPLNDRDGDGIVDDKDKCPDQPGPVRLEGCPSSDRDNDGTPDDKDKCPNTAGPPANDGCPQPTPKELDILNLAIRNLYFDTDKWDIWETSYPYLDQLAEILIEHPDWKLRIRGHADQRGDADYNLRLSKRRAEAVMFYLINRGVRRDQLIVEYFGELAPIAPSDDPASLQLNRRVEMEFVFE